MAYVWYNTDVLVLRGETNTHKLPMAIGFGVPFDLFSETMLV
jgi:hypothetical protein